MVLRILIIKRKRIVKKWNNLVIKNNFSQKEIACSVIVAKIREFHLIESDLANLHRRHFAFR